MDLYSLLREFADSWMLLTLFIFFVGMIFWVFRPGSKKSHSDSASIPFRHEEAPGQVTTNARPNAAKEA
ncbi:MAG: cbb3-type cytochrome c oxidase subunit 3 [Pseudooceanicola sp.]